MTNDLIGATTVTWDWTVSEGEFVPESDGNYNIGLHAICEAGSRLLVNSLMIEEVPTDSAPGAVTNLAGTPFATGALKVTIDFTAPTTTVGGSALTGMDYIEIRRNDVLMATIDDAEPGNDYEWVDEHALQGPNNDYKITAYKDGFPGATAEIKVFAGLDTPTAPVVTVSDLVGSVKLSWLPVTGQNGGAVPEDRVTYGVYNSLGGGNTELVEEMTGQYECTIDGIDTSEGDEQSAKVWYVLATTPAGTNSSAASVIMGKPYTTPYSLSFKNASLEGQFVAQQYNVVSGYWWGQTTYDCQDNDNGSMTLTCLVPANGKFYTGKIALDPDVQSKLSFYYKAEAALPGVIYVDITHRDGTVDEPVFVKDLNDNDNDEWHRVIVDMPAARGTDDYVTVAFHADMAGKPEANLYFDNISIFNDANDDVMVTLETPESVILGRDVELLAKMVNVGINDIEEGAKIEVFVNDEPVGETTLTEPLSTLKSVQVPVTFSTSTVNAPEGYNVRAVVSYNKDENAGNNEVSATITAEKADVKSPKNLETSDSNPVVLTWEAPSYEITEVTDDFESYDAWSTDLGVWTTIDNDGGHAASLAATLIYPHQYEEFAFMTWRPSDYFRPNQGVEPHSGEISLVAIYQQDEARKGVVASDNWLISPLLSGEQQTISIWYNNKRASYPRYGIETFEILASKSGKDVESFELVGSYTKRDAGWEELTFEVPAGTRFFAIHQVTQKDYANILMFDDITYVGSSAPESYNVYRDGELIASVMEPGYTDEIPDPKGTYRYEVTAVYNHNYESQPISSMKSQLIDSLEEQDSTFDVYTLSGVQLLKNAPSLRSLEPGLYIINGEKVYLRK